MPIYKNKGDKEDCTNYRPISLLPTFSKIYGKLIDKQIRSYMDEHKYWTPLQFGFPQSHETDHTGTRAIYEILNAKNNGMGTIAIFLDLKKAFDTVNHNLLIDKMAQYGIDTPLIKDYLSNRKQFTQIDEAKSDFNTIECGVPQGSILGPLFFLIYVNDLENTAPMKCLLFADDTTLLVHGKDTEDLIATTNEQINIINNWFQSNKLTVHPEKTNFMAFNIKDRKKLNGKIFWGNTKLQRIGKGEKDETIKYVGVHIDEDLKFKQHGLHVANKIKQNSYLISANKNFLPFTTRKLLYNALVRPHMDFGAEIWGHLNINLIYKAQKKCIRHVMKCKNYISHTNRYFHFLNTLKFPDIVWYHHIRMSFKLIYFKNLIGLSEVLPLAQSIGRTTRENNIYVMRHDRLSNHESKLPPILSPMTWNNLPEDYKSISNWYLLKFRLYSQTISGYDLEPECSRMDCPSCQTFSPFNPT